MKNLFVLASLIILVSCQKYIEIDLPQQEAKPVINCLFSPGRPFKLHVSLSKDPKDTASYLVNNAQVEIADDANSNIVLNSIGKGYYTNNSLVPKIGVTYNLRVKVPGYNEVTATTQIPANKIKVTKIESESGFKTEPVMGTGDEALVSVQLLNVEFLQNAQIPDFMGISIIGHPITHNIVNDSVFITEDIKFLSLGYLESNDPSIKSEGLDSYYEFNILMFRDYLFNQPSASVKFNVEKHISSKFWLRFFHFSPEAFNYIKSWIIHYYTQDYDFWEVYEPQPLYSNIENGYGIFAGYSEQLFEIYPDSTQTFK